MKLAVYSHKLVWRSERAPSGYATDGGFAFQMQALSELFAGTAVLVPCAATPRPTGEVPLRGDQFRIVPLSVPGGEGLTRKLLFPLWLLRNAPRLLGEFFRADAVHTPIPGDVGTIGMLLAHIFRKPLLVRHCGNWFICTTAAERFWKSFIERHAGGRNVMLATGGAPEPPSKMNAAVRWIFSSSLRVAELKSAARPREYPTGGCLRLVIACRQEQAKGTGTVIECLPLLAKKFPQVSLDVLGDGAALPAFRQQADRLGLNERVHFRGKVDHDAVIRHFQQADLFCFPTVSSEGFPKVVLEALACALPVITTRVSVLPQLLGTGGGILLNEATPAAVADAVVQALSSPDRYLRLCDEAANAAQGFSLERWRDTIGQWCREAWGKTLK